MKTFIKRLGIAMIVLGVSLAMAPSSQSIPLSITTEKVGNKEGKGIEKAMHNRLQADYGKLSLDNETLGLTTIDGRR